MPDKFPYAVFLSHSAKDKAVVRPLAERLRKDGVKVWFDEWEIPKAEGGRMKDEFQLHPSSLILSLARTGRSWRPARSERVNDPFAPR